VLRTAFRSRVKLEYYLVSFEKVLDFYQKTNYINYTAVFLFFLIVYIVLSTK
jgi:hypothetical protein